MGSELEAFLVGLIMPRGHGFTIAITEKIEGIVQSGLLAAGGLGVGVGVRGQGLEVGG